AYRDNGDNTGDLFALRVNERRTGAFVDCGRHQDYPGPEGSTLTIPGTCESHFIMSMRSSGGIFASAGFSRVTSGRVDVTIANGRFVGTVTDFVLEGVSSDSTLSRWQIQTGEFDLPLLTGDEAREMTYCFLSKATGRTCQVQQVSPSIAQGSPCATDVAHQVTWERQR